MKGVFVIYMIVAMFLTIANGEGYTGVEYNTGVNTTELTDDLSNVSYQYTNGSGITEPVYAVIGFLNVYMGIAANSLIFQTTIVGAPPVVNTIVSTLFGVFAWIAFYDFIIIALGVLVGVIGRFL